MINYHVQQKVDIHYFLNQWIHLNYGQCYLLKHYLNYSSSTFMIRWWVNSHLDRHGYCIVWWGWFHNRLMSIHYKIRIGSTFSSRSVMISIIIRIVMFCSIVGMISYLNYNPIWLVRRMILWLVVITLIHPEGRLKYQPNQC